MGRSLRRAGATPGEIDHAVRMVAYFASGADAAPTDHVLQLTGRPARPIEVLLDEHANDFEPASGFARAINRWTTKELR